jgi:hypothetical protein
LNVQRLSLRGVHCKLMVVETERLFVNADFKECRICRDVLSLGKFHPRKDTGHGYRSECKGCVRNIRLKHRYGLQPYEYEEMLEAQEGCCDICGKHSSKFKIELSVDHCHVSGKVRSLLCSNCNTAIGLLKHDVDITRSAIAYLNKHK